jgi:hypothetical protein
VRLQLVIGLGAIALLVSAAVPAAARPSAPRAGTIYFYANVGNPIPGTRFIPNPPRIRPSTLIEFEDGSWLIVNLRWSGWGGATARASGISSASNCKPNCAQGKRTHDPATLVVSQPKRFRGRTIYSCFQLTIPRTPVANQHYCLARSGKLYTYQPAAGSSVVLASFLSPDKKIWCTFSNIPGSRNAYCGTGNQTSGQEVPEHAAQLSSTGQLTLCDWAPGQDPRNACVQNWDQNAPVLKAGYIDLIYQYRCTSTASSVTCTVNSGSGKGIGFKITPTGVTKVSP